MRGFTLLEVLVAMSIFAVVGLGANQMLRTMIDTHERTQAVAETSSELNRAMLMVERDISQIVARPVRDEYGEYLPPLMTNSGVFAVELTRSGWNNPARLPRSNMQRVAYSLSADGELNRYSWLVLDRAEDSEPVTQTLLQRVEDFRVSTQHESGLTDMWPATDATTVLPLTVEVAIAIEGQGEVVRIFSLVSDPIPITRGDAGNGNQEVEQDDIPGDEDG